MSVGAASWTLGRLAALLLRFAPSLAGGDVRVTGVSQDSRRIQPGDVFCVRSGSNADAQRFIDDAITRGAVALLCERGLARSDLPRLEVDDVKGALAFAAEELAGRPSRALRLAGITGTNGKTTIASLVTQCLGLLSKPCAQLGTLGFRFPGHDEPSSLTTAEADRTSAFLRRAAEAGAGYAVMEVSSHALVQDRVAALHFAVAAFSNLTQDHLDFHGSLAEYGEAKARLFTVCKPERTVINTDDPFGRTLAARVEAPICVGSRADAELRRVGDAAHGFLRRLDFETPTGPLSFETRLVGAHNAENWSVCLGILLALGCDLSLVPEFAASVSGAAGRFERCDEPSDDVVVIVDYAHTPDALCRALEAARPLTTGRMVCVFGCGGDRDKTKRPLMGAAAGALSDLAVITNDNPRGEDPEQIARAIEAGLIGAVGSGRHEVRLDREQAIVHAVTLARPGDVVLIAGKGHEDYQIIGHERLHFDDREQARAALALRRSPRA